MALWDFGRVNDAMEEPIVGDLVSGYPSIIRHQFRNGLESNTPVRCRIIVFACDHLPCSHPVLTRVDLVLRVDWVCCLRCSRTF